jgi:poly-gamma-glutamate synthesis protein (capsule biosynthesis protein)
MKDGQVDLLQSSRLSAQRIYGGIFPLDHENFEIIKDVNPDLVIVISPTDETFEDASIILKENIYSTDIVQMLDELTFVSVNNEIPFDVNLPHKRVVTIFFTPDVSARESYRFSKMLEETVRATNKKVFVLALTDWSVSENSHIKELQNLTAQRIVTNLQNASIRKLKATNPEMIQSLLYYFHFMQAKKSVIEEVDDDFHILYLRGEEPDTINRTTLMAFGDVMLDRQVRVLMDRNGLTYPFDKISHEIGGTDFVFANFEGPIKEVPMATSKSISFRFKPDVAKVIRDAGINIVSVANNHALDQGWGGREDTKNFLRKYGVRFFGHPKNSREDNVYWSGLSGEYIAFVGFDDTIFKVDTEDASQFIKELDEQYDKVVVSIHWGVEYKHNPAQHHIDMAHTFVDSGADLVIGHHPHVVQTMEVYNDVPIFYSLGNFVFDQYFSLDTQEGLGIGVVFEDEKTVIYLLPYAIPNSQPTFMNEEERAVFLEKFISWGTYEEELTEQIKEGKIEVTKN